MSSCRFGERIRAVVCLPLLTFLCCREIALWRYVEVIRRQWKQYEARFGSRRVDACLELFWTELSPSQLFSLRFWSRIWAVYSLWDPSYSDQRSYGFYIDIGNGHSMLAPSLLWLVNSSLRAPLGPRWLGVLGIISFYQMFYGCLLYFISFFANRRHVGKSFHEVALFVGVSNGIWFIFSLLGLWASIHLVLDGSFAVLP